MRVIGRPLPKNKATWQHLWWHDQGRCQGPYCLDRPTWSLALAECYVDQRQGSLADSVPASHRRILCRRCYLLHARHRYGGLIVSALAEGLIGPDWRTLVWDD